MNGGGVFVLALIGIACWCLCSGGGGKRHATGHAHGGNRRTRAVHEAGHYVAAYKVGGYVSSADLARRGGQVQARNLPNAQASATFFLAGRYAAGTGAGCSGDDADARAAINEYPPSERSARRRAAERDARRIVSSHRGEIRRVAARLERDGHL